MLLIALLRIVKKWKQPKRSSVDEVVNKMYICTMAYYSTVKKNEALVQVTTWLMNLENIALSERNKLPKITYYMIPFI